MLKQKTPLKQKKPLKRKKPLRAKGISRPGQPRLTKAGIKTWAQSGSAASMAYRAEYKKWVAEVKKRHNAAAWQDGTPFCIICGKICNPIVHHWIYPRSQAKQYRLEPINGACICNQCHMAAHQSNAAYNECRLKIMDAFERYGLADKADIIAIYEKRYNKGV